MIQALEQRVAQLEEYLRTSRYDTRAVVQAELKQNFRQEYGPLANPALFSALCVNTIDPMAEGRVQYYTPFKTAPGTQVADLPWAWGISPFGGFDDCGVTWVPPAGSKLALLHENGDRNQAYYIGTFWPRTRGVAAKTDIIDRLVQLVKGQNSRTDVWGYIVPEYDLLHEGHRNGYNLGSNDGDQIKQPWNTDNHQTKDWDTQVDFDTNTNAQQLATYPHQYGYKTPGKHYVKHVDGDAKCNHRWRRSEWATGCGNIMMMKDDHLHPPQWGYSNTSSNTPCGGEEPNKNDCETVKKNRENDADANPFVNQFYKRKEEMRFLQPVPALAKYQAPKCELPQSGVQIQSIGGIQFVMDDSVDQPQGEPTWERDYDFGCTDMTKSKTFWRSQTGHVIEMNDSESDTLIRDEFNGVRVQSAMGNRLQFWDHTVGTKEKPEKAGDKRGVELESTSKHILKMQDKGNRQVGNPRRDGGVPAALADEAYVLLRSGYGLELMMMDSNSQEETQTQRILLQAPQKDNITRGPHQLLMQEAAEDAEEPGFVLLRAGGNFVVNVYDHYQETVGTDDKETPSNKSVQITGKYMTNVGEYYFNKNNLTMFQADTYIYLLAGKDCPRPPEDADGSPSTGAMENVQIAEQSARDGVPNQLPLNKVPCIHPVVVGKDPFVCPFTNFVHFGVMSDPADPTHKKLLHNSLSDRVFASASEENHQ